MLYISHVHTQSPRGVTGLIRCNNGSYQKWPDENIQTCLGSAARRLKSSHTMIALASFFYFFLKKKNYFLFSLVWIFGASTYCKRRRGFQNNPNFGGLVGDGTCRKVVLHSKRLCVWSVIAPNLAEMSVSFPFWRRRRLSPQEIASPSNNPTLEHSLCNISPGFWRWRGGGERDRARKQPNSKLDRSAA